MRDVLDQIRAANGAGLYYVALFSALAIPDICAALETQDGTTNGKKYRAWFDCWVAPKYSFFGGTSLTGDVCYYYRCAALHQGRATHPKMQYRRIIFVEPGNHGITMHNNVMDDALNIDVRIFCEDVISSCEAWLVSVAANPTVQQNLVSSMQRYPQGVRNHRVVYSLFKSK